MSSYPSYIMPLVNYWQQVKGNTFTVIFGFFLATTFFRSYAQNTNIDHFTTVDGHKMQYQIPGSVSPAVVFEVSGSYDHTNWSTIFPSVSNLITAFYFGGVGFPGLKLLTFPDVASPALIGGKDKLPYWVTNVIEWHQSTFLKSTEACLQVIHYPAHYIQLDAPEVVASAIQRVVYAGTENLLFQVLNNKCSNSALTIYKILTAKYPPHERSTKVFATADVGAINSKTIIISST